MCKHVQELKFGLSIGLSFLPLPSYILIILMSEQGDEPMARWKYFLARHRSKLNKI